MRLAPVLLLALAACPVAARAECTSILDKPLTAILRPVIENADLCKNLRKRVKVAGIKVKLAVDQTKRVSLDSLGFCTNGAQSELDSSVNVTCETSPAATVNLELSETFDIKASIDLPACRLTALAITSHGIIGELVLANRSYRDKAHEAIEKNLQRLCAG